MGVVMLGVGDYGASRSPEDVVKTLALGSCVAVVMLDPATRTVGMVHVALPESSISPEKCKERPGYFADTGIPALIETMREHGSTSSGQKMIVKLAGGAQVMDPNNTFNIGKRNQLAVKKILWQFGMGAISEDLGGHISRSVAVSPKDGRVRITSSARGEWEI